MPRPNRPATLRETVQVYLQPDDRNLLARLVEETGLSEAEILRRGIRSFAREQRVGSPMLRFVAETEAKGRRADIARTHDDTLVKSYRVLPSKKRR